MDLDPVELVLEAAIAGRRRQLAGVGFEVRHPGVGGQSPGRRRDRAQPVRNLVVRRRTIDGADVGQHPHLPYGLAAAGGVDAEGRLEQGLRILDCGHVALPDVDIHQVRATRRQRLWIRIVGLCGVVERRGAGQVCQPRIPGIGRAAVVLGEQAVHVDAARADRQAAAGRLDAEAVRRHPRHGTTAEAVEGAGLDAAGDLRDPFVPVGVQLDATLLHDHPEKILAVIEADAAQIETHGGLPLRFRS